jgi:hypothetical protein
LLLFGISSKESRNPGKDKDPVASFRKILYRRQEGRCLPRFLSSFEKKESSGTFFSWLPGFLRGERDLLKLFSWFPSSEGRVVRV